MNAHKRDKLDTLLADIDLLLESKVEFCVIAVRFDHEQWDAYLVRAVDLPLLPVGRAVPPIAEHVAGAVKYYGPGVFLPACYPHDVTRISITEDGQSKKTNAYLSVEQAHNIERSSFLRIGTTDLHVDVIGSREDGLMTFLYKRADDIFLIPQ